MALVVVKPQAISTTGTFTRASSATRVNSSGVIETVGVDVLRTSYNPTRLSDPPAVLVEMQATNVIRNASGAQAPSSCAVTTGTITGPDGSTALKVVTNAGAVSYPGIGSGAAQGFVNSKTVGQSTDYVYTAYFAGFGPRNYKPYIVMHASDIGLANPVYCLVYFDCNTGTFGPRYLGPGFAALSSPSAELMPCGMWKVTIAVRFTQQSTLKAWVCVYLQIFNEANASVYVADGASGFQFACMQFEEGSRPTSYIPTTSAAVTRAADVLTGTGIIATDVPENDYAAYNAGTTYALGDRVILVSTHTVYESLQASNTGHDPSLAASATWWLPLKPTNRWALLDTSNTTATAQATSAYYLLQPGTNINTLAVTGLANCTGARVQQIHPTQGTVYDQSRQLYPAPSAPDWFSWFMLAHESVSTQAVFDDLYPWPDTAVMISLVGGADLACANLVVGYQTEVGYGIEYGAKIGIQDYSRIVTNTHGDTVLEQRAYAKRMAFSLKVPNDQMDLVIAYLESIRATPVLWIGSNQYESTVIFGFYQDWDLVIAYPNHSAITANIQGMS